MLTIDDCELLTEEGRTMACGASTQSERGRKGENLFVGGGKGKGRGERDVIDDW